MIESIHIEKFRGKNDLGIPNIGKINLIVGKNYEDRITVLEDIQHIYEETHHVVILTDIGEVAHYTEHDAIWGKVFVCTREHGAQVFATTNSRDAVESFSRVAAANKDIDCALIRLGRSAKTSNKGDIIATVMDADMLADAIAAGIEVR